MLITSGSTLPVVSSLPAVSPDASAKTSLLPHTTAPVVTENFSATAQQLSEAAVRAAERDKTATLDERNSRITATLRPLTGAAYQSRKTLHDAEQPDTQDSGLLARARQATDFSNGLAVNPFKNMAPDQLKLIAHDDSSTFTVNERRAAWQALEPNDTLPRENLTTRKHQQGHDVLVSRLFYGHEGPERDKTHGLLRETISVPDVDFLTRQDRYLLSHMYAYAQEQGAHLKYVDDLAWDLADYRRHDDGRVLANSNGGHSYDEQGRQLSFSFTAPNAAIAQRVLGGAAINVTLLDKGFVRYNLDPSIWPYHNGGDPGFLEQMILKFSGTDGEEHVLDSRFKTYTRDPKIKDKIVHACETIRFQPRGEPALINKEGVWTITATGKAEGYVLNRVTGIPEKIESAVETPAKPKIPSNPFEGLIGGKPARPRLLTLFDYLFMKMKTHGRVRRP